MHTLIFYSLSTDYSTPFLRYSHSTDDCTPTLLAFYWWFYSRSTRILLMILLPFYSHSTGDFNPCCWSRMGVEQNAHTKTLLLLLSGELRWDCLPTRRAHWDFAPASLPAPLMRSLANRTRAPRLCFCFSRPSSDEIACQQNARTETLLLLLSQLRWWDHLPTEHADRDSASVSLPASMRLLWQQKARTETALETAEPFGF